MVLDLEQLKLYSGEFKEINYNDAIVIVHVICFRDLYSTMSV